jgi:hypothetical protein
MRRRVLFFAASIPLFAACGGNNMGNESGPDANAGPPDAAPFMTAQHEGPPQLVSGTGSTIATPKLQPIFFASDPFEADTVTFMNTMASDPTYWTATTSEYGVGALTILPAIDSTDAAPTSDQGFETYLATMADGTHDGWPKNDGTIIYTVFIPTTVTTLSDYPGMCSQWLGYHSAAMDSSGNGLVYSMIPYCPSIGGSQQGTDYFYVRTNALSHETIEAATDPMLDAYFKMDPDHYIWGRTPGAETGDLCEYVTAAHAHNLGGGAYAAQRTWSNASAMAGHDPCVPAPAGAYNAATPVLDDSITVTGRNGTITAKGVSIPVGTSKTIEVDLWSDSPSTDDIKVNAYDLAQLSTGTAQLTFAWDKQSGKNGDKLMLTINHVKAGSTRSGGSEFVVTVGNIDADTSEFYGLVGN